MSAFLWPEDQTEFVAGTVPPEDVESAWYFVFEGSNILDRSDDTGEWVPLDHDDWGYLSGTKHVSHYMGHMNGHHCFAVEAFGLEAETLTDLRSILPRTPHLVFGLASRAVQIVDWYRSHQFCGSCGGRNRQHDRDRAMVCDECGIHAYPRLSPSIIVLVHRGSEALLARNHRFPEGMFSTLAGFVEPGESIEETLIREVEEEVGVRVHNLEYQGSQSWPFPNSLMLGFLAEYESGDIVCQEEEIADARWFPASELPFIPGKFAISRWLIDTWLTRLGVPV